MILSLRTIHSGSFNTVFSEAELMVLKVVEMSSKRFTMEGGSNSLGHKWAYLIGRVQGSFNKFAAISKILKTYISTAM